MVGKKREEEYFMPHNMYMKYNIVSPPNVSVEVVTPSTSKCGLNLLMCRYNWLMLVILELSGPSNPV